MASDKKSDKKPFYESSWFELLTLAACLGLAYALFSFMAPSVSMDTEAIQAVGMAKLFSEGRILEAFNRFYQPPLYPMLLSLVIKGMHSVDLPKLIDGFRALNLGLYLLSIGLTHWFVRRQVRRPYALAITVLFALAPSTLDLAWGINAEMTYLTLSMATLLVIDYSLSRESAEGGDISRGELLASSGLIAASILTRQLGLMLLAAFFFIMLKRMGLKKSAIVLTLTLLCLSPFIGKDVFNFLRNPPQIAGSSLTLPPDKGKQGILPTVQAYGEQVVSMVTRHAVGELNLSALQTGKSGAQERRIDVNRQPWGRWVLGALAIIGALYGLYQYTGVGTLYLCAYLITAVVVLPGQHLSLAPILPLLLFYLYFGLMRMGDWLKRVHLPITRIAAPALTAWILLCSGTTLLTQWSDTAPAKRISSGRSAKVVYMRTDRAPETRLQEAQKDSAHRRAMDWLSENTPSHARIARPRPEAAGTLAASSQKEPVRQALGRYDYLVEESASRIQPLQTRPGQLDERGLRLVYEDVPGRIRIWQIQPDFQ